MKIHIEGEGTDEDILALATFLRKRWQGRPEHINVLIEEGTDTMTTHQCIELLKKVWSDKE
jgi:hypothetical protein